MIMTSLERTKNRRRRDCAGSRAGLGRNGFALGVRNFSPKVALACSFQAEESVLIDMMHRLRGADFRILLWIPAGSIRKPTIAWTRSARRYGVSVEVYFPDAIKVQNMVRASG